MQDFFESYRREIQVAYESIEVEELHSVGLRLWSAFQSRRRVFIAGNGGSAALADHFACDLSKTCAGPNPRTQSKRFAAHSLSANAATMTAWANDEGYQYIFSEQLRNFAQKGDVLVVISASGNSPNIIEALSEARKMGLESIALLGFEGGKAKTMCDHRIHVRSPDYGVVEGLHSVFVHLLTRWLRAKTLDMDVVVSEEIIEELAKVS